MVMGSLVQDIALASNSTIGQGDSQSARSLEQAVLEITGMLTVALGEVDLLLRGRHLLRVSRCWLGYEAGLRSVV